MTAVWQSGHTYVPGSLVKPLTTPAPGPVQIVNGDFETGTLSGWTQSLGAWSIDTTHPYAGASCATTSTSGAGPGAAATLDQAAVPCKPGQSITLGAYAEITNAGTNNGYAAVFLLWYNSGMGLISVSGGNQISGQGGAYHNTTVTGSAPAGCAFVVARLTATAPSGGTIRYDNVSWNYVSIAAPAGLIFKATQAAPGKSGSSEPAWPSTVGVSVTDNQVTWEGVLATRLIWQASPLMTSGGTEPAWPTQNGGSVRDGTINWTAQSSAITDVNCPHSKIVMIAASKVYAADNDIIRYCATVNPLDWTTPDDAGYIAFGLQTYGSNPVAAMNLYRSNLVPFNAEGFQMWQVDPDPANIDLLDALPIASTFNRALAPVANDLLFLSSQGVRSVGIAASSTNLQAGDVGMPIDILVQEAMSVSKANAVEPLSTYVPAAGQYWLAFSHYPPDALSISGDLPNGRIGDVVSYQYVVTGGVLPYGPVTITSGSLPPGLTMSATGLVTGTLTTDGNFAWVVSVQDAVGTIATLHDTCVVDITYSVWDPMTQPAYGVLSNTNKTFSNGIGTIGALYNDAPLSGKVYFEYDITSTLPTGGFVFAGVAGSAFDRIQQPFTASGTAGPESVAIRAPTLGVFANGTSLGNIDTGAQVSPLRIYIACDVAARAVWFGARGSAGWVGGGNPASGTSPTYVIPGTDPLWAAASLQDTVGGSVTIVPDGGSFAGTVPTGFVPGLIIPNPARQVTVLGPLVSNPAITLSNGNLKGTDTGTTLTITAAVSNNTKATGNPYWEVTAISAVNNQKRAQWGISTTGGNYAAYQQVHAAQCVLLGSDGYAYVNDVPSGAAVVAGGINTGDIIRNQFNIATGVYQIAVSGGAWITLATGITGPGWRVMLATYYGGFTAEGGTFNFGGSPFVYAVPSGCDAGWL